MDTNNTPAPVALTCSECGVGHYYSDPFMGGDVYECDQCGHHIAGCDVDLEAGERMTMDSEGRLSYTPAEEGSDTCTCLDLNGAGGNTPSGIGWTDCPLHD